MQLHSKFSENLPIDQEKIGWLQDLVKKGEGQHLEFKARATQADKIVKELIAFANTKGGRLLIGVDDDGRISGLKFPEEESFLVAKALKKYCWPIIRLKTTFIRLTSKRWVVVIDVGESKRKPIRFRETRNKLNHYIRFEDKTIQASREAEGILKLRYNRTPHVFTYTDIENRLLKTIDRVASTSLPELSAIMGLNESELSSSLINLAAANVIGWEPKEPHDRFYSVIH